MSGWVAQVRAETPTFHLRDDPDFVEKKRELFDVLREWRIQSGYYTRQWAEAWR